MQRTNPIEDVQRLITDQITGKEPRMTPNEQLFALTLQNLDARIKDLERTLTTHTTQQTTQKGGKKRLSKKGSQKGSKKGSRKGSKK